MNVAVKSSLNHYKILSPLGAGGMGEVFLAEDTRLLRKVAIKLLADEFRQDSAKLERFRREARAASALNHPNILTIYEIGISEDSTYFIVTEFIEGQTLREKISEGDLTLAEIMHIAVQTVEALAAAHEVGIVHRDIKPENIMIRRDGYVKVLDFGLAKLFERNNGGEEIESEAETRKLIDTDPNVVMGTAKYMSPEQIRGKACDARSDIFSFGAVLYEMLAGRSPFEAETVPDILAGVLHKKPLPVTELAKDAPEDLQNIVNKSLRKKRDERYQTIAELLDDLKNLQEKLTIEARAKRDVESVKSSILPKVSSGEEDIRESILVTEFENLTGEEVFDSTLTTALAFTLEQTPFLNVFPDSRARSTLRLMGRETDSQITGELGREICLRHGIKAYITGKISSLGKIYVLNLEAVNAQTGEIIGRQLEQAESKETVLETLGKAASGLREKLGESLSSIEKFPPLCERTTSSLEALRLYSLGDRYIDEGKYEEALSLFQKAIEIDPEFAIAYVKLAAICTNIAQPKEAAKYGKKAFELSERVSELEKLRITDFYYSFITGELEKSLEILKIYKLNYPQRSRGYVSLSDRLFRLGQFEKAIEEARQAIRLSPKAYTGYLNLAEPLIALNRFSEAEEVLEKSIEGGLSTVYSYKCLYHIAFCRNDKKSLAVQLGEIKDLGDELTALDLQTKTAASLGKWKEAKDFLRRVIALASADRRHAVAAQYLAEQALRISFLMTDAKDFSIDEDSLAELKSHVRRSLDFERNQITLSRNALALAFAGDLREAKNLVGELKIEYPKDTLVNHLWIPIIEAAIALRESNYSKALENLELIERYDRAGELYPKYLRALIFWKSNKIDRAVLEFEKIINNRGESPLSILYPLAKLGKARIQNDAKEFERFFEFWKEADEDLPILIEARNEYNIL